MLSSGFAPFLIRKHPSSLQVGSLQSDFNSGSFSYPFKTEQTIELYVDTTSPPFFRFSVPSFPYLDQVTSVPLADTLSLTLTATLTTRKSNTETTKAFLSTPFFPLSLRPSNPNKRAVMHLMMADLMSRSRRARRTRWSSEFRLYFLSSAVPTRL